MANGIMLVWCGNYLLRSILFPYSNYFITKRLESELNRRFALEFAKLLDTAVVDGLKVMTGKTTLENYGK